VDLKHQKLKIISIELEIKKSKNISQSETRIACGGHVCQWIETECAIFIEDLP
jgi:hypothetical protein